ncbi:hypothetical protein [Pelomonas sp. KK5]|uniref:hypothetical protein n=1 Tax=Pelomonas sp. KK5 TaxID=1855730 RepID=UPI001301B916|nr:hypothetical protein [Pelomonas sp. KK5]
MYIMELGPERNGSKCGCECRSCGHPLKAANAGKAAGTYIQKPHFKHRTGVVKDACLVLVARAAALRLLVEEGMIDLPSRTRTMSWKGLSGAEYQGTAEIQAQRRRVANFQFQDRTNAVVTLDDGKQVVVQLTGTNIRPQPFSGEVADGRATIFIDIDDPRLAGLSPDELRSRLKLLPELLCWHGHWDDLALQREAASVAMAQAQEMLDWPDGINEQDLEAVPAELRRETLLHLTVKQILAASGHLRVPAMEIHEVAGSGGSRATASSILVKEQSLELSATRLEHRLGKVIPDVCADAVDADGHSLGLLCIEATVTNGFDRERLERVRRANLLTLEVDLSDAFGRISRSELAKLVIDGLPGKRWIHHPEFFPRQEDLRVAAAAASGAKAKELDDALRAEWEASASRAFSAPALSPSDALVPTIDLPSPEEDRVRCRLKLKSYRSGWTPSEDLLDGLLSLRHGVGIGHHSGLSLGQVAHKLRCTIDTRLHCLILIALHEFGAGASDADRTVLDEWAASTREKLRAKDPMRTPPPGALLLLKELLPELSAAVDKLIEFIRRPQLPVRWTSGEPSASRLQKARAMRRELYHDGAYRLYGPRIDYDHVMEEARIARARQGDLASLLSKWAKEYALGEDLRPIINILREAGLVA